MSPPSDTPTTLLARLAGADPTRPRLTWYDDREGPTHGERIELSGRVLATWAAKAANLLQEDLDVAPGSVVAVDLPAHWRAAYWLLAVWSVGGTAVVPPSGEPGGGPLEPDVLITTEPRHPLAEAADRVVAVSLPALARAWSGPSLPSGVIDEAAELASYGDRFAAWTPPSPTSLALQAFSGQWMYGDLVPSARAAAAAAGLAEGARVMTSAGPDRAVPVWLAAWTVDGSLVLVGNDKDKGKGAGDDAEIARRASVERVTDHL